MLAVATVLLGFALLGGAGAAIAARLRSAKASPAWLAYAHGGVAIAGYALLLVALPGAQRGQETGTQSFGAVSAALIGAAVLAALAMLRARLRKRPVGGLVIGIHATLAVSGFVLLAVYVALG
jgi:hypothetical protein